MPDCLINTVMFTNQTAVNTSAVVDAIVGGQMVRTVAFHANWLGSTTVGVVTIEVAGLSAANTAPTGTWAAVGTLTFSGTAPNNQVFRENACAYQYRARISTTVTGTAGAGVTVVAVGN